MLRNGIEIDEHQWTLFSAWADEHNVSLEYEEDWGDWWDAWKNGWDAAKADNVLLEHIPHPQSSNIHSSAYDSEKQILEVTFKNGSSYHYHAVPQAVRDAMLSASSVGSFLNKNIKGVFEYKKIK